MESFQDRINLSKLITFLLLYDDSAMDEIVVKAGNNPDGLF